MDWNTAIEKNREALKSVLAMLVAMAGGGAFLPRHLHRAVLRLLRPAEAAARRLVIVAARGLAATPQARKEETVRPPAPPRPHKPKPTSTILRNGVGSGIVMPPQASLARTAPRSLALPLFDPLPGWGGRVRPVARGVPRISVPGYSVPFPIPAPPSPNDPIDARRLLLRLEALGRVLDDLQAEARRFARRRCRVAAGAQNRELRVAAGAQNKKTHGAGRFRRVWPLRPGRPPGWCRNPKHEVHEILNVTHGLAIWALEDTS
jgi:hypothetical protein